MKPLYKILAPIKLALVHDQKVSSGFTIILDDGEKISFETYHAGDCCEHVYADFTVMEYMKDDLLKKRFKSLKISGIKGMGFLLHFDDKKFFIPCHNYQNGYYSSKLELIITKGRTKKTIDISDLVEDHID